MTRVLLDNADLTLAYLDNDTYELTLKDGAGIVVRGQINARYDGLEYLPGDVGSYIVAANAFGLAVDLDDAQGVEAGRLFLEHGYGELRAVAHGARIDELCEIVFGQNRVNVNTRAWERPVLGSTWLINEQEVES